MRASEYHLPGIKFIGWISGDRLKQCVFLDGIVGQPVPILTDIHQIDFCNEPECSCKSEKSGKSFVDTATLKFLTASALPISREQNIAFVVTDIADKSWLIGSKEPPHADFKIEIRHGSPGGDSAGFYYEITHVSCKSMIPCVI